MTIKEAARILGISQRNIHRHIKNKKLKAVKHPLTGRVYVSDEQIEDILRFVKQKN